MRAVRYDAFGARPYLTDVADPAPSTDGVVIAVTATGLCRSDWHGWQGHDPDITSLPHIPGHEFAGVITDVGRAVTRCRVGDRVTVPFVCACGRCRTCAEGDGQVCPHQWQPGFSGAGSFAEAVAIPAADVNVVRLPDGITDVAAAALGCRFATAYRAVMHVAAVRPGEVVAVFGCGGVGRSAIMVAVAQGARVIAVDTAARARALARDAGAAVAIDPGDGDLGDAIGDLAPGGIDVGIDALGDRALAAASITALRPRGRHVQVGLLPRAGADAGPPIPMHTVIARELTVLGSHGMAAAAYPEMLARITGGWVRPDRLVTRVVRLDDLPEALAGMSAPTGSDVTVCVP